MDKISKRAIQTFARKVAKEFKPQKIILFGSYAYGKPTADSDVDVLIVMSFSGRNPEKATEIWMATKPKFPVDIMVRKPSELKKRLAMGDFFLQDVVTMGKVLYEATHA